MPLTTNLVGMHYRYPDHYEVEREKIREYAVAVQNDGAWYFEEKAASELGYKGLLAPLTLSASSATWRSRRFSSTPTSR